MTKLRSARCAAVLVAILLTGGCIGCGYSAGGPYRPDMKTVYVEMFDSKEFRRDIEFKLTEAIKKRIATDTPYRVVAKEKADTILKGEVLEERQAAFAPDFRSRQPREKQLTLAVRVEWQNVRTGELVEKPVILQAADYLPPTGETEAFAQERAIDRLAQRIVAQLYDDW
ncbi:MAG: LptE family protein [Phycisphaerales bacterium]|nr:LptE family protein [Phycisphaerales bacterium]